MIDMIDMIGARQWSRRSAEHWRAGVPTSRLPLCGRMVAGSVKHALNGLAVAVSLLFVSACRTSAPEVGRYQWSIVPSKDGRKMFFYVVDTVTGELAEWSGASWTPSNEAPLSVPDWDDIRQQRKEAREEREALVKAYAQMPFEKQVAWAKSISVCKFNGYTCARRRGSDGSEKVADLVLVECLKGGHRSPATTELPQSYKATDKGLVVWFHGEVDGDLLDFGLSHTPIPDVSRVFAASTTIIDDVKAEIKRQEKRQKPDGVDVREEAVK
jgi:hypothetical protein